MRGVRQISLRLLFPGLSENIRRYRYMFQLHMISYGRGVKINLEHYLQVLSANKSYGSQAARVTSGLLRQRR